MKDFSRYMTVGKLVVFVGAAFFLIYGLAFTLIPIEMSSFVTDTSPTSSSGIIDMRATYGGMSIAIGLILVFLAKKDSTVHVAMGMLLWLMLGMAFTRVLGMLIDGNPNTIMYIYLGLELVLAFICGFWLSKGQLGVD
ncbi:DUF4345 domain-containing protein [Glaciecola petra]|uniref:DUF4345 domain-containing protein n=1 Tax=Glaciecola petra TaxID=3075602 RepID=A0ABU2ZPB5_9ALTE|nr:DUF4345 domain-containing protein [Aestuariibacter sp. P117]MDT0594463.1 DUF4345 domain-containing protein [Aestuariibacter sp. P117]